MAKTAVVTLGGVDYTVHAFNLDELQEVGELLAGGNANGGTTIKILKVALRRAQPPLNNPGEVEVDNFTEVNAAASAVLRLAGLVTDENPQAAAPA